MKPVDKNALGNLIRPAVIGQGYELVDIEWLHQQGAWILRVTIDRLPGKGYISHEDCASVSREVSALLDVYEAMPYQNYNLEVSSPGVNRPLKSAADFQRFVGKRAKVRLRAGVAAPEAATAPQRNFTGTIEAVEGDVVRLVQDGTTQPVDLPIKEMEKANLVYQ